MSKSGPIITVILACAAALIAWGRHEQRISHIEQDVSVLVGDHDVIVQLSTDIKYMQERASEQWTDIKDIKRTVESIRLDIVE